MIGKSLWYSISGCPCSLWDLDSLRKILDNVGFILRVENMKLKFDYSHLLVELLIPNDATMPSSITFRDNGHWFKVALEKAALVDNLEILL